jgi:hypothetical protein
MDCCHVDECFARIRRTIILPPTNRNSERDTKFYTSYRMTSSNSHCMTMQKIAYRIQENEGKQQNIKPTCDRLITVQCFFILVRARFIHNFFILNKINQHIYNSINKVELIHPLCNLQPSKTFSA